MAITLVNIATTTFDTGISASPVFNLPANLASGDLLMLIVSNDGQFGAVSLTATGWTTRIDHNLETAPDGQTSWVLWKIASGSEGSTVTGSATNTTNNQVVVLAFCFRGVDNATPFDVADATTTETSAIDSPAAASVSGITTATANACVLQVWCWDNTGGTPSTSRTSLTSGFSEIGEIALGWSEVTAATKIFSSAGATGSISITWTLTSGHTGWFAITMALRPEAGFAFEDDGFAPKAQPDPGILLAVW
jgi:hypothetical protein